MGFLDVEPWQRGFFEGEPCEGVEVPVNDGAAWATYPRHRWVYDRLALALSQGLPAAPHGVDPPRYPVFSKPIVNLHGMGAGSRVVRSRREPLATPGHFWMPVLRGEHLSTDLAIARGRAVWCRTTRGHPARGGTFDRWELLARPRRRETEFLARWCRDRLRGFTGMANFETLGGTIIEAHLRFSSQFADLYGEGFLEAVVRLHREARWRFDDRPQRGFSLPLFTRDGGAWAADDAAVERLRPGTTRLQLAFVPGVPLSTEPGPPGGFLLAYVNGRDLDALRGIRHRLRRHLHRAG